MDDFLSYLMLLMSIVIGCVFMGIFAVSLLNVIPRHDSFQNNYIFVIIYTFQCSLLLFSVIKVWVSYVYFDLLCLDYSITYM
jgi:hypothetical protein